ncbi:MAG: ATP synthase subunit I [Pseudomonadota bacterium]
MKTDPLHKIDLLNAAVTVVATVVGFSVFSAKVGVGLLCGAGLMALNLFVLRRLVGAIVNASPKGMFVTVSLLFLKLGLFFTAVWAAMTYLPINPFAFGLGAAAIIVTMAVTASLQKQTPTGAG